MKSSQFRGKANTFSSEGSQNRGRGQDQNKPRSKAKTSLLNGSQNTGRGQDQNHTSSQRPKFDPIAFREEIQASLTKAEISFLVELILSEGNNIERIRKSLQGKDVKKFEKLSKKISLEKNYLSRMCNVMVEVTCDVLVQSPTIGPVSLETCIKESGLEEFPTVARHAACASLIPHSFNFRAEALEVVMMVNMMFSEKIQTPEWKSLPSHEKFSDTFAFVAKTFKSPILKEDERWELCRKYEVVTDDHEFTEPWLKAIVVANRYLKDNYSSELQTLLFGVEVVKF